MRTIVMGAWGAMTAAALGCGGGGSTAGSGGTSSASTASAMHSSSAGTGGSNAITCTGAPTALALDGTWVAYGELSVKLQGAPGGAITICPADQVGAATILLMITVQQSTTDPTKLDSIVATMCSLELPTVTALVGTCDPSSPSLVTTQIIAPQTFIDALPKVVNAMVSGTLTGTTAGAGFALTPLDIVVGSSKNGSMLPAWDDTLSGCKASGIGASGACDTMCVSDCASAKDDDADSFPGVTVQVSGYISDDKKMGSMCHADMPAMQGTILQGKAFIDVEVNPTLTGTVKSSCEISGNVDTQINYHVLGADVRLGGQPISVSSAIHSLPSFQVDAQASKFRMVRVDGKYTAPNWSVDPTQPSAACKTMIQRVNEL